MADGSAPGGVADGCRAIGEVAQELDLPQHVLRFWETRFPEIRPVKRAGGRRFYRSEDVALLRAVRALLYTDGYTIRGVQRLMGEVGARRIADAFSQASEGGAAPAPERAPGVDAEPAPPNANAGPPAAERPRRAARADPPSGGRPASVLRAVLSDLSECERLLSSLVTTED